MSLILLKGNIISAPAFGRLETLEHGYLAAENGAHHRG